MMTLNRVCLIGNLGKDPEIRRTADGSAVANFSIATSEVWTDKGTNEKRERTQWHNITVWPEQLVKIAEQYLRKGRRVYVEGQLEYRKWQDRDGKDRISSDVVLRQFKSQLIMLDSRDGGQRGDYGHDDERPPKQVDRSANGGYGSHRSDERPPLKDDMNDDIPF
jgi:single-strand DNA-binding protein